MNNLLSSIPFSYPSIIRHHFGNDQTILDFGCGDGELVKKLNADKKYQITGVDLYKPAIASARKTGLYKNVVLSDLRKLKYKRKSFDVVLASQVIEHFPKKEALRLIKAMEKLARKKVIICTPKGYVPFEPFNVLDKNPLQAHKSGWGIAEMRSLGYRVYGQGTGFIYRPEGLLYKLRALKNILAVVSALLAPLIYFFPQFSATIICVKE